MCSIAVTFDFIIYEQDMSFLLFKSDSNMSRCTILNREDGTKRVIYHFELRPTNYAEVLDMIRSVVDNIKYKEIFGIDIHFTGTGTPIPIHVYKQATALSAMLIESYTHPHER